MVDWVAFTTEHVEQDIEVFTGHTRQFVFISSASAYQKPPSSYLITEDTPLTDIATIMSEKKVHILPVLRAGRIVGIVGKRDVVRAVAQQAG